MSWQASAWALKQATGSAPAKLVLLTIANYCDENGECFPRQTTIAEHTEQSVDTVQRRLRELERLGLIFRRRSAKGNGWRGADRIVLLHSPEAIAHALHYGYDPAEPAGGEGEPGEAAAAPAAMRETHDEAGGEYDDIPAREADETTSGAPRPQIAALAKAANCGVGQSRTGAAAIDKDQFLNPVPPLNPPRPEPAPCGAAAASDGPAGWLDDWRAFEGAWDWAASENREQARRAMQRLSPDDRRSAVEWAGAQGLAMREARARRVTARVWLRDRGFETMARVGGAGRPARVFVRLGSPAWEAWEALWRKRSNMPATMRMFSVETTIGGERLRGAWRDTLFPPAPGTGPPGGA